MKISLRQNTLGIIQERIGLNKRYKSSLPVKADAVIIGGGISGISTAYHLARKSPMSVVLLEKTEITSGSTWHAAGLITTYHPGVNIKKLHWRSLNLYARLEKETGQAVGFHQCGSLRLATSPIRLEEMKYQMGRQGWHDAPQILLNKREVKELMPLMDMDGANVLGGLYNPYDGHIDPYSLTQAIAKGARNAGVKIMQNTPVKSLTKVDGGWVVGTHNGDISATHVVNAGGFWAKEIGNLCGLSLPLVPVEHQYLVTKSVPPVRSLSKEFPVLRHLDGSFYLRRERDDCLLVGPYECQESMKTVDEWALHGVPEGFGKELFPPDLDRLQPHLEKAMELLPCFADAQIQSVVNGPITYTPDVLPIIGPTKLPNMWISAGYAYGIAHGGGAGDFLSDWILNGEPPYHLSEVDPSRYGDWTSTEYTLTKVRESYGWNNAPSYSIEDRPAGRTLTRRTSEHIYSEMMSSNAFMGNNYGWEQALWFSSEVPQGFKPSFYRNENFTGILKEVESCKKGLVLRDVSAASKFIINGEGSHNFLNALISGSLPQTGSTKSCLLLNDTSGTIYAECNVSAIDKDEYFIVGSAGTETYLSRHMEKFKKKLGYPKVIIKNLTEEMGVLSLAGPQSTPLLSKYLKESWSYLDSGRVFIDGLKVFLIKFSTTGEEGWEIYANRLNNDLDLLFDLLRREGHEKGLSFMGSISNDILRLEKGFKSWGSEYNSDVTPFQADAEHLVNFDKPINFLGKESLLRAKGQPLSSILVLLSVDNDKEMPVDPEGNMSVWLSGKVVGHTTSGAFSPALGKGLAFALVPPLFSLPGTEIEVEVMGKHRKSLVLKSPPSTIVI